MASITLAAIESAIRSSWALDTCDDVDVDDWSPDNPARGQCGVTTLVLHDLLGGDLAVAEVWDGDRQQGYHSWLRTDGGVEIDLTLEQFAATELVGEPRFFERPHPRPGRCAAQYDVLRQRVFNSLGLDRAASEG